MTMERPRFAFALLAALGLATAALSPAVAGGEDDKNIVRIGGSYVNVVASTPRTSGFPVDNVMVLWAFDDSTAPFVSWERRIGPKAGLELSISRISLDLASEATHTVLLGPDEFVMRETISGGTTMTPIELALVYHGGTSDRWDFYIGAMLAYVLYDDLEHDASQVVRQLDPDVPATGNRIGLNNRMGWGVLIGLDLMTRPDGPWRFSFSARRLFTQAEFTESKTSLAIDIDPWEWRLGLGYRF